MAQMPQGATLDQLGVPQEYRDRAKIMWILTAIWGLFGWIVCNFIWKIEGQDQNQWYQFQLKQNLFVGIISWVGSAIFGLGWIVGFIFGLMGFLAINGGKDFEAPIVGGMAKK
jgi:hypothetical protein